MRSFYASLFALVMPSFERLQPVEERNLCRRLIAKAIADAHAKVMIVMMMRGRDGMMRLRDTCGFET
jgi:hypothetical protein